MPRLLLTLAALAALGGGPFGCAERPAGEPDPLAGAPGGWEELLGWARERLSEPRDAIAAPEATSLPDVRWQRLRLVAPERLRGAERTRRWSRPAADARPLAEVRGARSDRATATVRPIVLGPNRSPNGQRALVLDMRGFRVERRQVGSLELRVRVPYGRHFQLRWGRAGEIVVPLTGADRPLAVSILTDTFAEWEGPLRSITLVTDGFEPGATVEVESLRFMPRRDAYPEAIGTAAVRLSDEIRRAVYMHAGETLTYRRLRLPAKAKLQVGLGAATTDDVRGDVRFEALVDGEPVLTRAGVPADGWDDLDVSLARFGGREVSLTLRVSGAPPETVAFWGNPVVYAPVERPPIVVVYLIDTLASGHVGLYGHSRATMPRLRVVASEGAWFPRMVSNSSRTIESIPDLMLSLPTERHDVHDTYTRVPPGLVTLAEVLQAAGFATASFCTNVNAGPRQGLDAGFDSFFDHIGYWWNGDTLDRTVPLDDVASWLDAHADRPMFLYVHTAEPHAPYVPPTGFRGRFDGDYAGGVTGRYDRQRGFQRLTCRDRQARARDVAHVAALYDEEIAYADHRMGLFLDELGRRGLLDRTHLFVTSDHGEEFLEHCAWEHGENLHGEQTRVPLVVAGPAVRARGRQDVPAQVMDVMPTVLDLLDLPEPYPLDGTSLLPVLRGTRGAGAVLRDRSVFGSNHRWRRNGVVEHFVISEGRWKLLAGRAGVALFDLEADPGEHVNLLDEQRELARELLGELIAWRTARPPYAQLEERVYSRSVADALRALGYVDGPEPTPARGR